MSYLVTVTDENTGQIVGKFGGVPSGMAMGLVTLINQGLAALRTASEAKQQLALAKGLLERWGVVSGPQPKRRRRE